MRAVSRVVLTAIVVYVSACSLKVELHLYNNTMASVEVTYKGRTGMKTTVVEHGKSLDFGSAEFEIRVKNCTLSYALRGVPPEEFIRVAGISRHLSLQLQEDGRVFAVRAGDATPVVASDHGQPDGFPLEPRRACQEG